MIPGPNGLTLVEPPNTQQQAQGHPATNAVEPFIGLGSNIHHG